ncbi:IS3 family transposase [Streptomyces sp. NBC_01723]|uniref:IS3 family transposase n=1 Tax=Streptomyces sp. NBC_01723 TaxID=2975921 RepID=UPI003FCCC80F
MRDAELIAEVRRIHQANYGVYGARKVWHQLRRAGIPVARCTVERLMRAEGLAGAVRGRKVRTTVPGKDGRRAGDLVNRDFHAAGPDRLWVADFTYVPSWAGTVYVAFCVDAFSRRNLGWEASMSWHTSLFWTWSNKSGLIHHSDAGSQGGLKWSSQHLLITEVCNGTTEEADAAGATGCAAAVGSG